MQKKYSSVYSTLLLISLGHFLVDFMIGIWPIYKSIAHLDLALAGLISGLSALAGEGLQIFFGPLSDRGYRNYLIIGGIAAACATTFLAYTSLYFYFFLIFLFTCIGSGAFHPAAASLAGGLTSSRKALFISIFAAFGGLGLASSQLIFTHFYKLLEGHTVFLAIPSLCLIAIVAFFGLSQIQTPSNQRNHHIKIKSLLKFFYVPELRRLYIAQVCNQSLLWGFMFLLPEVLISRGHEEWVCFGGGHLCFVVGGALMMVPSGYLSDKYSPRTVLLISTLAGISLFYTFLFFPNLPSSYLLFLVFSLGALLGAINPLLVSFGNRLVPSHPGMISAFLMGLAWCIAEGLGQFGGGLLTKLFEEDAAAKALTILGAFLLIGAYMTARLPKIITPKSQLEIAIDTP